MGIMKPHVSSTTKGDIDATSNQLNTQLQASIKRVTSTCKQLLLGLLDEESLSDEQISIQYTAVVKAFYQTIDDFAQVHLPVADLEDFPELLRQGLEHVFHQSSSATHPGPDGNAQSVDSTDYYDKQVAGEHINLLITRLIRGLQERARSLPESLLQLKSSSTSPTSMNGHPSRCSSFYADVFEEFRKLNRGHSRSRNGSKRSPSRSRQSSVVNEVVVPSTVVSPESPKANHGELTHIIKEYLSYHRMNFTNFQLISSCQNFLIYTLQIPSQVAPH
jgi:hypothetical protein